MVFGKCLLDILASLMVFLIDQNHALGFTPFAMLSADVHHSQLDPVA